MTLGVLLACLDPAAFGGSERDVRPAGESVRWSGYVLRSGDEDALPLTDGHVVFMTSEDGSAHEAAQPSPTDYPGYWSADLPADVPVTVRIDGPGLRTAAWPMRTPRETANWSAGTLFAADTAWIDARFERAAREAGLDAPAWRDDRVRAWGFWRDGATGDCATTSLGDARVVCLATDAAGVLEAVTEGPYDSWYAWDLAPGPLVFAAIGDSGTTTRVALQAEAGDVATFAWLVPAP
jgi:hypothetical protein